MIIGIAQVALLVREYDEAIAFYSRKLGFTVVEDSLMPQGKRWVRLQAPGKAGSQILLSRADNEAQRAAIGNQSAGRVLFFMHTDNFTQDHEKLLSQGVEFTEPPRTTAYGKVVVMKDLYGNRIDLIQPNSNSVLMGLEDGRGFLI